MIDNLVNNSKYAMISAIEIHNKPLFPYRYEVVTILIINSWELILKAYLLKNKPEIKVVREDGTTKPFEECLESVKSSIGINFFASSENIKNIYIYRCSTIHFFQENLDVLLYSLSSKSVEFYSDFILEHFGIDLTEENNLILLPIGFKRPISPLIYLSEKAGSDKPSPIIQDFIKRIITSTNTLIENNINDAILVEYKLSLINENRISNADIKAAITKDSDKATLQIANVLPEILNFSEDENAKKIKLEEETIFGKIYTDPYDDVTSKCKDLFSDFVMNTKFHDIMRNLKNNPQFHKKRYLDAIKQEGVGKDYYTKAIYDEFANIIRKILTSTQHRLGKSGAEVLY